MKRFGKSWIVVLLSFLYLIHCLPTALAQESTRSGHDTRRQADKRTSVVKKNSAGRKRLKGRRASSGRQQRSRVTSGARTRIKLSRKRAISPQARHRAGSRAHRTKTARPVRRSSRVIGAHASPGRLRSLSAEAAFVIDPSTGDELYARNAGEVLPIASITKLMTALVVRDAR
jgi:D-alanyl-D-alanine endopeptidase (penicillin-binding protein 7)